ncbi:MAG: hypothetical protein NT166_24820 [Candidatus Aminicenantes bacterium]|nr:hypothetical protein [Candidatus Aminicenantes bacterium]
MNSITVTFEKQGEKYSRSVTFPDGKRVTEQDIQIKKQWHSPETWQWSKPLHEYSREELSKEGNHIAHVLLGQQGRDFLAALEPNSPDNETNMQILILEHTALPEIARIPWEIACIGREFIVTQRFIPIIRRPQPMAGPQTKKKWPLHEPLKLLLVSASPKDQTRLHVENELLKAARAAVDNDANPYHDFYQFVHLSTWTGDETWEIRPRPKEEGVRLTEEEQAAYRSEHYIELDKNFVGRFEYISRIEETWWNESAHVVGLHGLGGIGKTYLCSRMQQRVLFYAVPAKRLNKSIFIDFRQGTGHTLGLFLNQLTGIAHDLGFSEYEKVVEDDEKFPTALEKLREFRRWLDSRFQGKVLLILDNLESALDEAGLFRDEELGKWFRLLVGQTSKATKILVTCRFRFEFFPDGRDIVEGRWFHLGELGITERLCFLNRWADLRNKTWEEKEEILQAAGGHPYLLKMVLKYVQRNRDLPEAILKASKETAAYARLDGFLSMLSPDALEWLIVAAVFPEPRWMNGILITRSIRDVVKDMETLPKTFQQATEEWTKLSLAAVEDNEITIDPLLVFQLLDNEESLFRQTGEKIEDLRNAVGRFILLLAGQTEERPGKATILRLGVETVLAQGSWT